ncbi:MAG: cytidine deaminase [Hyphomonas sp.]|uniref:cytidine deaminase n=1 Tax=Hyphomonas sp. TaxID=87 RepID=UPI0032662E6E
MTNPSPSLIERLQAAASAAREHAHAPYSKFKVGAAVLDDQGRVFAGCNMENAAYPLGTCAEAVALGAMVVAGGKTCTHVLVIGGEGDLSPCGGCRQRIAELCSPDCVVYALAADGTALKEWKMADLLPHAFELHR